MADRKTTLETAAFLDSDAARSLSLPRADVREVTQRFLECAYQQLGKAPHLLDGEDLTVLLTVHLPTHFGRRDPLAEAVEPVLSAFLEDLAERTMVPHAYELEQALESAALGFRAEVERGAGDPSMHAPPAAIENRGEKVGRNDPCPCGSGKKFKKCCARLGESS